MNRFIVRQTTETAFFSKCRPVMRDSRICFALSTVFGLTCVCSALAAEPTTNPTRRSVEIKYRCQIDQICERAKSVDLWVRVATNNERQTVRLLAEDLFEKCRFTTDKPFGNRMFYRRYHEPLDASENDAGDKVVTSNGEQIQPKFTYDVLVNEATVPEAKQLISTKQVQPPVEFAPCLGKTTMIPINGRLSRMTHGRDVIPKPPQQGRLVNMLMLRSPSSTPNRGMSKGTDTTKTSPACLKPLRQQNSKSRLMFVS